MTFRNGGIIGIIVGVVLFAFFKFAEMNPNMTDVQLKTANTVFFFAQISFLIGIGISLISLFRRRNLLTTTGDGILLGLSGIFDIISFALAWATGQSPIPK